LPSGVTKRGWESVPASVAEHRGALCRRRCKKMVLPVFNPKPVAEVSRVACDGLMRRLPAA
jgi:hypothetical protein